MASAAEFSHFISLILDLSGMSNLDVACACEFTFSLLAVLFECSLTYAANIKHQSFVTSDILIWFAIKLK